MKKSLIMGLLVTSFNLYAKKWYEEKGTLHAATANEWHDANYANKLATAGDLVATGFQKKVFVDKIKFTNMGQVKVFAEGLVKCIDKGIEDKSGKLLPTAKNQPVNQLAIVCMQFMGWLK